MPFCCFKRSISSNSTDGTSVRPMLVARDPDFNRPIIFQEVSPSRTRIGKGSNKKNKQRITDNTGFANASQGTTISKYVNSNAFDQDSMTSLSTLSKVDLLRFTAATDKNMVNRNNLGTIPRTRKDSLQEDTITLATLTTNNDNHNQQESMTTKTPSVNKHLTNNSDMGDTELLKPTDNAIIYTNKSTQDSLPTFKSLF